VFVPWWLKNDSTPAPARKSVAPRHFRPRKTVSHSYSTGWIHSEFTKGVLAGVADGGVSARYQYVGLRDSRDIQEAILVLVLFVDAAHEGGSGWEDFVDEDEDGLLRAELDALADNVDELADSEICWDQILLLVDGSDV
jgi:hypothetical protein